jgi:hypothetical protein
MYPVDSGGTGYPDLSGIVSPTIWSGKLLVKFYDASVVPAISNTDYEGDIKAQGDTVKIRTTPDITVNDYLQGQILDVEFPTPTVVDLFIDHGKYWNFLGEDVEKAQGDYDFVNDWTQDAAEQVKINVDTEILADIHGDVDAANAGSTAGAISGNIDLGTTGTWVTVTSANILDVLVDCGTVLDEQNAPESDRWIVLPAWMCGMIKKSDLQDASLAGDGTSILRNGRLGMIDRFEIFRSNLLDVTVDGVDNVTNCLFGHKSALTFAGQFTNSESLRSEKYFGTLHRGLKVYGYEVIKPTVMGLLYASAA